MTHSILPTIALGLLAAFVLALVLARLRIPAIVGYLLGGLLVGPHTPGFVGNSAAAGELAEVGVILLMFGVGLHFSLQDLRKVWKIAVPGAVIQIIVASLLGTWLARSWGWPLLSGLVFGLSLSCASTVVLLKALESRALGKHPHGHIAIGWLLVEDIVCVVVLLLLPTLAAMQGVQGGGGSTLLTVLKLVFLALLKIGVLAALMLFAGTRGVRWLLHEVLRHNSSELFTLAILGISVGLAYLVAILFNVSFALGAFLAGALVNGQPSSHRILNKIEPLQDTFSVLFFVSVGMLFDPRILVQHPVKVLWVLAIVLGGKTAAAFLLMRLMRFGNDAARVVSAGLAQIGEFSFILASLSMAVGLLTPEGYQLIIAGSIISIALNPTLFAGATRKRLPAEGAGVLTGR